MICCFATFPNLSFAVVGQQQTLIEHLTLCQNVGNSEIIAIVVLLMNTHHFKSNFRECEDFDKENILNQISVNLYFSLFYVHAHGTEFFLHLRNRLYYSVRLLHSRSWDTVYSILTQYSLLR